MAQLGQAFDPNAVEPGGFDDMPSGDHVMQIVESSVEPTKNGRGKLVKLTWQVLEDQPHANRKMWQNINFEHESAQAQTIGQQQLKAICDAVCYTDHLEDTEVLHFIPCRVTVGMGKANGQYAAKPEIKRVKPLQAQPPAGKTAPTQQQAQQGQQPQSTATKPPPAKTAAGPGGNRPWGNPRPAA